MGKYTHKRLWLIPTLLLIIVACKQRPKNEQPQIGFYYWKSHFQLNDFEQKKVDSTGAKVIFIKFFDVVWNEAKNMAEPVAVLQANTNDTSIFKPNFGCRYAVAPTVFITNETMQKINDTVINSLVNNIYILTINTLSKYGFNSVVEYQFDCDWTASTKEKYFTFLTKMKTLLKNSNTNVSATIRLHQIKFMNKTGVPPVDKGLLMCYNMGNLKDINSKNSIIDEKVFAEYASKLSVYPLPLDVALPLFEWKVWFRDNQFKGLFSHIKDEILTTDFCIFDNNKITLQLDTVLGGQYFEKGDVLRIEKSDKAAIANISAQLAKGLKQAPQRVLYYAIDSVILNKFYSNEMVQWSGSIADN